MTKFGFLSLKFGDPCHLVGMPARCGTGAHAASTRDSASRDVRIEVIVYRVPEPEGDCTAVREESCAHRIRPMPTRRHTMAGTGRRSGAWPDRKKSTRS